MSKSSASRTPRGEVTPWFPSRIKPVRRGIYQRHFGTIGIRFAYWTGEYWGGFADRYSHAVQNRRFRTGHQTAKWRGLARKL